MLLGDARSGKLAENIVGFSRALRRAGLPIDSARIGLAQQAAALVGVSRRQDLYAGLESVLVSREEDRQVFGELFEAFFRDPEIARQLMAQLLPSAKAAAHPPKRGPRAAEALTPPRSSTPPKTSREDEVSLDAAMSASDIERLRHADFQSLSASEFVLMERLVREVPLPIPEMRSRRYRSASRGLRPDWSRLVRETARYAGEAPQMGFLRHQYRPLPILILVDVSGSMERYARLLLAFLHQATRGVRRSVFSFGVSLTDLGRAFRERDTDRMLALSTTLIPDFAGGTRLGDSLAELHSHHRGALIGRRSIVLLITDGLDTGDTQQLDRELSWLSRQSRRLFWLNPLLRFEGYRPLASGATVLHRYADRSLAIHNLSHVESLARELAVLMKTP
ncbi:MAG: VWA domain-containing protein [Burkholderiaceae bacterium]|nr:VWA domain-containing protein [Burkholderiaceae bacterium]